MTDEFDRYWADYLYAHHNRSTRVCHYAGTAAGAALVAYGVFLLSALLVVAGVATTYAIAIGSHYVFEGRRPLVLRNPLWGAISDLRMLVLACAGRLESEFREHGIEMN